MARQLFLFFYCPNAGRLGIELYILGKEGGKRLQKVRWLDKQLGCTFIKNPGIQIPVL